MATCELNDLLVKIRTVHFELDTAILEKACDEMTSLWEWGIERISAEDLRDAVKFYYCCIVPGEFFVAPSSTSGRHHPFWHNEAGGIVRHLTECCVSADRLLQAFGFVYYADMKEYVEKRARDIVLAATLISDTFKNGSPWGEHSLKNHGEIAARFWRLTATGRVDEEVGEQIAQAVHWHYGRYTPVPEGEHAEFEYLPKLTQLIHLLDMCSSNNDYKLIYRPVDKIPSPESVRP